MIFGKLPWTLSVLVLLSLLSLISASRLPKARKRGVKRKTFEEPEPTPFEKSRKEILGLRDGRPAYSSGEGIDILPDDVWAEIFKRVFTSPVHFLTALRINKTFFTILVNNHGFFLKDLVPNEEALTAMILDSEMQLNISMMPLLHAMISSMSTSESKYLSSERRSCASDIGLITFYRTDDLELLSAVLSIKDMRFPNVSLPCIYRLNKEPKYERPSNLYFKKPDSEERDLLDLFDAKLILAATCNASNIYVSSIFVPSLISEYILPSYRGTRQLTEDEKAKIKGISNRATRPFRAYFKFLRLACYLITGEIKKAEKTVIQPIASHLEDLGLNWTQMFTGLPSKNDLKSTRARIGPMRSIFKIAVQWGLDIKKIAEATKSWSPHSKDILDGSSNEYLETAESGSVTEIISIIHDIMHPELIIQAFSPHACSYFDADSPIFQKLADEYAQKLNLLNGMNAPATAVPLLAEQVTEGDIEALCPNFMAWDAFSRPEPTNEDVEMEEEDWLTGPWTTYHEKHEESG